MTEKAQYCGGVGIVWEECMWQTTELTLCMASICCACAATISPGERGGERGGRKG